MLKWVAPESMHVTVKFLGNVPQSRIHAIVAAAGEATGRADPFTLTLTNLGAFPNDRSPRVIWVGLADDAGTAALAHLFGEVEGALAGIGFEREVKQYSPHITLARTRDDVSGSDRRLIGEQLRSVHEMRGDMRRRFDVDRLTLMQSVLTRTGPVYTPLTQLSLDGIETTATGIQAQPRRSRQ
jgi:2'-5' RNA ligase